MATHYQPKNAEELKQRALRDARLAAVAARIPEPATQPGSDLDILATMLANTALLGFHNINSLERERSIFTCSDEVLEQTRIDEGLPEVTPAGSKGRLKIEVLGPTTIPNGLQFKLPNQLRGRVVGGYQNPANGSEVDVEAIDTGPATNFKGGTEVKFVSPPTNLAVTAFVSTNVPLSGGIGAETPERKRSRILNVRRNKPAGANWAQLRQIATDSLGSVQDAYVYPTIGGPSSQKVVPVKAYDRKNNDYSRTLPDAALAVIRSAIHSKVSADETIVQAVANQLVDFGIQIEIPASTLAGGNGQGWVDENPWPPLHASDNGKVVVTATDADFDQITLLANTSTAPTAGLTHIAWWSSVDRKFYRALVISRSGGAGAWVLTLDRPLVDSSGNGPVIGGDYISPDAQNLDGYGAKWIDIFEALGPGENASSVDARMPRAKRHPYASDEDPSAITRATLGKIVQAYPEITDHAFSYSPTTTPTVPGSVNLAPNVLVPRRLGFYPL